MYLFGASGHAKVVIDILASQNITVKALFDDNEDITELLGIPVLHDLTIKSPLIISVGDNDARKKISERIIVEYGRAIHSSAIVSSFVEIGLGSVVMQGAIIQSCSQIGKHCIINTGASIDHDCIIDDFVHISPRATLCGNVSVGEGTWIGASATIIEGVKIGKWSIVGAGSVVTKDIPDNVIMVGVPAKILKYKEVCKNTFNSLQPIAIYGVGGFGREVLALINTINQKEPKYHFIGFFDDGIPKGTKTKYGEILGNIDDLNKINQPLCLALAIGSSTILHNLLQRIVSTHITFVNLIHPTVEIDDSVKMGKGNIITYGNFISCDVTIGDFNIFNTKCAVGHDTVIGSFNVFNPNSQISGDVTIGDENFWGLNSSVIQGKQVGNNNKIGACSFVIRNVKDDMSLFGIPATKQ